MFKATYAKLTLHDDFVILKGFHAGLIGTPPLIHASSP